MEKKYIGTGEFKRLVATGGIDEVVARKIDNKHFVLFGVSQNKDHVFMIRKARTGEPKTWVRLDYLENFVVKTKAKSFNVIGLN
ncbi:hypothetical protein KO527_05390 [Pseudoalteromonas sp. C2R02]|uniref:hypothetical protein n=1 Tax=Pseudoalteromonas sp. C2R02 TaxID=2841565 RepID=UPI001C09CF4B|nr:hypothetical protein [Pseudoalteromonas sp. C2R02]MBU2968782.1 hypothetical protein [Pseudoalteromonas sp. C2R02]